MKILITGGAGFIGYHLAKSLLASNHQITITDIINQKELDDQIELLIQNKNCDYHNIDLLEPNFYLNINKNYDLIIHLAAIVGVENVISNSFGVLKKNQLMLLNVLDFARRMKSKPRLIFTSTSEVYAGSQFYGTLNYPTKEETILSLPDLSLPRTSYMLSKLYGEALCHASEIECLVIRPHNIYGPRMGMKHVIPQLLKKILLTEKGGTIDVFSPNHMRTFCYIDYAVEKIKIFAENQSWDIKTVNLGVESPEIEIRELAKLLIKITDREDLTINELENTQGSPSRRVPCTYHLIKHTKDTQIPTIDYGVKQTYDWYKSRINKYE